VALRPDWPRAHGRLGAALHGLGRFGAAADAYRRGLALDPDGGVALRQGVVDAERSLAAATAAVPIPEPSSMGSKDGDDASHAPSQQLVAIAAMLSQPDIWPAIALNDATRPLLSDQRFCESLREVQRRRDGRGLEAIVQRDKGIALVLTEILGVKVMSAAESHEHEERAARTREQNEKARRDREEQERREAEEAAERERREAMTPEQLAAAAKRAEADAIKDEGNAHYKRKDLDAAVERYDAAIAMCPEVAAYRTNRAAVRFEQGRMDECRADCEEAVSLARAEGGKDAFKLVSRALTRLGNCDVREGKFAEGIARFEAALVEHRNPDTLGKLRAAQKALREAEVASYIDMDKCADEKAKGNEAFTAGRYPEAVGHYTEALKRGPPPPVGPNAEAFKLLSNRAACYTKLGAWDAGLADADECVRLAPAFGKGYLRKATLQMLKKDYDAALETFQRGMEVEPDSDELIDGVRKCVRTIEAINAGELGETELKLRQERALADPEVQRILQDPSINQVLKELQETPESAGAHLKDPVIFTKLMRLQRAGILRLG
jgi:stress-induced-phosphoprotein 1